MTKREVHESRRPDPGFWVERAREIRRVDVKGKQGGQGEQEEVWL
jgi:hypothetical protein